MPAPTIIDLDELEELTVLPSPQGMLPKPDEKMFFIVYTPYLKNPFSFDPLIFRDYELWILGSYGYVLNTFAKLDADRILALYIKKLQPRTLNDWCRLTHFVSHLELCVPGLYQQRIEELIHSLE